jgi:hypothetical protein
MALDGRFSTFVISPWVDQLAGMVHWLALVNADPYGVSDPLTVEVLGDLYDRIAPTWERSAPNVLMLADTVYWRNLTPGTRVAGVAGFDAPFNGHMLYADLLDAPIDYPTGGNFILPQGEYFLGVDVPSG